jgi:hypothetical protein
LTIRKVWSSSGAGNVRAMPQGTECPSSSHGCDISKLANGSEYRLDVSGPDALALHVVETQASASGSSPAAELVDGVGFRGVRLRDGERSVAIVTAKDRNAASLSYRVPAADGALHVVVDAPVDNNGKSDVKAVREGTDCHVDVTPHQGAGSGLSGRPLVLRANGDCTFSDDGEQAAQDSSGFDPVAGTGGAGGSASLPGGGPNGNTQALGGNAASPGGVMAAAAPRAPSSGCTFATSPLASTPARQMAAGGGALAAVLGLRFRRRSKTLRARRRSLDA